MLLFALNCILKARLEALKQLATPSFSPVGLVRLRKPTFHLNHLTLNTI